MLATFSFLDFCLILPWISLQTKDKNQTFFTFFFFPKMAELRPSGFPEYSPAQQLIFDQVKAIIERNYQQFGYTHIHTPAVERSEVLLSKSGEET